VEFFKRRREKVFASDIIFAFEFHCKRIIAKMGVQRNDRFDLLGGAVRSDVLRRGATVRELPR
jgi:hypothetical protein